MNHDHPKNEIIITGMSGAGKTTLWLRMMREHKATWKWIFDADREVHTKLRWPRAVTEKELEYYTYHRQPVCFDPSQMFPGARPEGFAFFARWCMNAAQLPELRGVKLVGVDELRKVQRPGIGGVPIKFLEMADSGRHYEVDMLCVAHSPHQVHCDVRMHMSEIITFRHGDPKPTAALAEHGFNVSEVSALHYPGGYIRRNLQTGQQTSYAPDAQRKASRAKTIKG